MRLPEREHGQIGRYGDEDEDGRSERRGEPSQEWEGEERRKEPGGEVGKTSGEGGEGGWWVGHWEWVDGASYG